MNEVVTSSGKDPAPGLQFDQIEPPPLPESAAAAPEAASPEPTMACQLCERPIGEAYYELGGKVACPDCHARVLAAWHGGSGAGRLLRSLALGAGAGLAGCLVYYLVLKLTGYEFGLIAILVGWAVGAAVRRGSGGRGGWPFQLLAVGLTYLSIVGSYLPLVLAEMAEVNLVTLIVLVPVLLVSPFLAGLENILGLVIIAFGLWEAWRLNRRQELSASGPYRAAAA